MVQQKQFKTHKEVPNKYKWDLSFLLEGKTIEERMDELIKMVRATIKDKDSKYDSKHAYLKSLKTEDKITEKYFKVHNYLVNNGALNTVDPVIKGLQQKLQFAMYEIDQEMGPEQPRFNKHVDKIKEWIKDKDFDPYRRDIQDKIDSKKHQLPDAIQEFRLQESRADIDAGDIFTILTNAELDFGEAEDSKGNKTKITNANRSVLMKSLDKKIRITTNKNYINGYMRHKSTLSNLLFQHFKKASVWSKLTKHNSTIDYLVYGDRVNEDFLKTLYKAVESNIHLFKKARKWHGKFYEAKFNEKITKYDYSVDLVDVKAEYSPEEAMELVLESVKPFGDEYYNKVKDAFFKENWVDMMPVKNKRTGAYSIGASWGLDKKLIEMNFDGTIRSVETLAHEMGHSMHSYFSDTRNPISQSQYPIFVAEIASIFNELLLFDHLLNNSKDEKLRFHILQSIVEGFQATVWRQVMWSNYEYDLYKAIEKGQPISSHEALSKFYFDSTKKYNIKDKEAEYKPETAYECFMVPHYYYGFYVYKYAIGQLVANIFFQKYKEEGVESLQEYIDKFLTSGARDWPLEVLKGAGVDLNDPKTYTYGFKAFENAINKWVESGKKVFNMK